MREFVGEDELHANAVELKLRQVLEQLRIGIDAETHDAHFPARQVSGRGGELDAVFS